MSQIPLTNEARHEALQRFGYTEREARFLCLAALHGGYFLREFPVSVRDCSQR